MPSGTARTAANAGARLSISLKKHAFLELVVHPSWG